MTTDTDIDTAKNQAQAQLESILGMVKALEDAGDDVTEPQQIIQEDALDVQVRSAWHTPGDTDAPAAYMILLWVFIARKRSRAATDAMLQL